MALARWQATISNEAGDIQPGATVEVRSELSGALVQLYSDRGGVTSIGNPFTVGDDAFAAFHCVGGVYKITAANGEYQRIWRYVGIGTAAEYDLNQGDCYLVFESVALASSATIADNIIAVIIPTAVGLQRWGLTSDPGTLSAWHFRTANGKVFYLRTDRPCPEDFGAVGDDVSDDVESIAAVRDYAHAFSVQPCLTAGKTYYVSGEVYLGIWHSLWHVGNNAAIRGPLNAIEDKIKVDAPLKIIFDDGTTTWDYWCTPQHQKRLTEKSLTITESDLDRAQDYPVDCGADLAHYSYDYPGNDTVASGSPAATSSDGVAWGVTDDDTFKLSLRPSFPGEQLTAYYADDNSAGNFNRVLSIRTSNGMILFCFTQNSSAFLYYKPVGEGYDTISDIEWEGWATDAYTHPMYSGNWAYFGIRNYDRKTFGIVFNGHEIARYTIGEGDLPASLGVITETGFGVLNTTAAMTIGQWSVRKNMQEGVGARKMGLLVIGDSLSSTYHADWPEQWREAVNYSFGAKAEIIANYAVVGNTSAQQLSYLIAHGVPAGTTHALVLLGGNDQQGGVALSTYISNLNDIIDILDGAGVICHMALTNLPYTKTEAPDHGYNFGVYTLSAPYRTAALAVAAGRSIKCTETNSTLMVQNPAYLTDGSEETVLRDNIHLTSGSYRAFAYQLARDMLSTWIKPFTNKLSPEPIRTSQLRNSWAASTYAARFAIDESGLLRFSGVLDAGTKADGTVVLALAPNLRPARDCFFVCLTNSMAGVMIRVEGSTGNVRVYGMQSGDAYVYLDQIAFQIGEVAAGGLSPALVSRTSTQNRATNSDDAGTILQTAAADKFRAGMFGSADYRIQRNSSGWKDSLKIDASTGVISGESGEMATKAYVDGIADTLDLWQDKGDINCSTNPNYPAASKGHAYYVSAAGKIGGSSGVVVEVGDWAYCRVDSSASGNQATVGGNWSIVQVNIDGAVRGPAAATDGAFARYDGTTGKLLKDGAAYVPLTSWTPSCSAQGGTLGTYAVNVAKYMQIGKLVFGYFDISITSAGTSPTGYLSVIGPVGGSGTSCGAASGSDIATGKTCGGRFFGPGSAFSLFLDGGSTPTANGTRVVCTFMYETP